MFKKLLLFLLSSITVCNVVLGHESLKSPFAEKKSIKNAAIGFAKVAVGAAGLSALSFLHQACESNRSIHRHFIHFDVHADVLIFKNCVKSAALLGSSAFTIYSGFKDIFNAIGDKKTKTKCVSALAACSLAGAIVYTLNMQL